MRKIHFSLFNCQLCFCFWKSHNHNTWYCIIECEYYLNNNLNVTIISTAQNSITFKLDGPKVYLDQFNCLAETITVVNANALHYGFWNAKDCFQTFSSVTLSYWSYSGGKGAQYIERTSNSCYVADENGQYFFSFANNYVTSFIAMITEFSSGRLWKHCCFHLWKKCCSYCFCSNPSRNNAWYLGNLDFILD